MNYKKFLLFKIFFLFIAFWWAIFLLFVEKTQDATLDRSLVFVLDVNRTMNTQDVAVGEKFISRLDAAKQIIPKIIESEPGFSYGLVIFNGWTDYIVPPTFDTGTFLLYLSGITTNLLAEQDKNFAILTGIVATKKLILYIVLSDFDVDTFQYVSLAKTTQLIGLWSAQADYVRQRNGVRYASGASVSSSRNDSIAQQFDLPYMVVSALDEFSPQKIVFGGMHLPLSQRMVLYVILGVFALLGVML